VVDRPGLIENVSPTTQIRTGEDARAYIPLHREQQQVPPLRSLRSASVGMTKLWRDGARRYSPSITETSGSTIFARRTETVVPDSGRTNKIAIFAKRSHH
jgi:hypothetical protein